MGDGVATCDGSSFGAMTSNSANFNNRKLKVKFDVLNYVSGEIRVPPSYRQDGLDVRYSANGSYELVYNSINSAFALNTVNFIGSIDNISVIEITDDTDIPRIDYTSGQGALLLEPQSTNLVPYSEDFSVWNANEVTTQTGFLAPDGSNNAIKITSTGSQSYLVLSGLSLTGTDTRTIYARTVSGTGTVNLCSYGQNTNNNFTITEQWQRFEVNGTTTSTGEANFYGVDFRFPAANALSELIIWGAQAEALSFATSYIKTEGSTVTRSADVANNSGNADLFNDSEGVLYAEIAALADDATNRKIAIGTSSNRIIFGYKNSSNQIRVEVISSGSVVFDNSQTIDDVTTFSKFAIKYKQNDFALWMNGEEIAIDTSGNPPIGLSELAFDDGGSNNFYGNVKCVAVFKEALTDAELESLTSWVSFTEMATDLEYTLE